MKTIAGKLEFPLDIAKYFCKFLSRMDFISLIIACDADVELNSGYHHCALKAGDVDKLFWFAEKGCKLSGTKLRIAMKVIARKRGLESLISYTAMLGIEDDEIPNMASIGAERGDLDLLKWNILRYKPRMSKYMRIFDAANKTGNMEVIRWVCNNRYKYPAITLIFESARKRDPIMFKLIVLEGFFTVDNLLSSSDVILYLAEIDDGWYAEKFGPPIRFLYRGLYLINSMFHTIALNGIKIRDWAWKNGARPVIVNGYTGNIVELVNEKCVYSVKWLKDQGIKFTRNDMLYTINKGCLETVKIIMESNDELVFDEACMYVASTYPNWDIVVWAHDEKKCPLISRLLYMAKEQNDEIMLQWLEESRCPRGFLDAIVRDEVIS